MTRSEQPSIRKAHSSMGRATPRISADQPQSRLLRVRGSEDHNLHGQADAFRNRVWPNGNVPIVSPEELEETSSWINNAMSGVIPFGNNPEGKALHLLWVTDHVRQERTLVEEVFQTYSDRQPNEQILGSITSQINTDGVNTCVIASAINALKFLGKYNPRIHTERRFLTELVNRFGQDFISMARQNGGMDPNDLVTVLPMLAPGIRIRGSNSVSEMLVAAENGATVLFPISNGHEGTIPPGHGLRRGSRGELEVLIANPLLEQARYLPVEQILKGPTSIRVFNPATNSYDNNCVLIIEKIPAVQVAPPPRHSIRLARAPR